MESNSQTSDQKRALAELKTVLYENQKFVKVHAAEFLIWTGHSELALKEFLSEEKLYSQEPKYRIVIWRVLAQAETEPARKQIWLDKIYQAYQNMEAPDRTHATETLAKLKQPVSSLFPDATAATLKSEDRNLQTYALWASSLGSEILINQNRQKFLDMVLLDSNVIISRISAFVLRQMRNLDLGQWNRLADTALATRPDNEMYVTFLATALVTAPLGADSQKLRQIDSKLLEGVWNYTQGQRNELSLALAEKGKKDHLAVLKGILKNKKSKGKYDASSEEGADLRASAAYAILKIYSREEK